MTGFFGSQRARFLSRSALTLIALLAVSPLVEVAVSHAENDGSGAAQLRAQRKAMRSGKPFSQAEKPKASQASLHAPVATGKATTATEVVTSKAVQPFLSANATADMSAAEAHYAAIVAAGGWPTLPKGTYKKGAQGDAIAALNKRLFIEGYLRPEAAQGEFAPVFTSATQDSITRFQSNMGLAVTGNVDGATLAALNVPAASRLATIRANIARVAMYSQDLGDRYIVVNVPAQQIQAVSGGRVYSQHNAIVGRPERPTPVVMTALSDINFNPYWNAPPSIIERDIIPKIEKGSTEILDKMNIKVFKGFGGPEIDPSTVDWNNAVADDYHFRQEPGGENAMATAKINFSSPFGIYLHDTPERQLFQAGGRFFSSGCVRVDKVAILLNWILNGQDGIDSARIANLAETLERLDVKINNPPQLRVAYLTAWPAGGGLAAFRNDVYQLDGTGFVIGQPMPVGETSPDGERFVLKPIPRQVAAVDAAEAEGFTWFGHKFGSKSASKPAASVDNSVSDATVTADQPVKKTAPAATASKLKASEPVTVPPKAKLANNKSNPAKKAYKGLFDWDSYYAAQAKDGSVKKPLKSKTAIKATAANAKSASTKPGSDTKTKPVVAQAKGKNDTAKKMDVKVASGDKKAADKAATADAAKVKKPVAPKTAAADAKKVTTDKAVAADTKKPAVDPAKTKKPAVDCAKDKTAKECTAAQVPAKKKKPVEAAAN